MEALIQSLIQKGVLRSKHMIAAFRAVDRRYFVLPADVAHAYEDHPLSIGYDQTISQPYTVAFMLELLLPRVGQTILDVGSGSGWTTALLAQIVGVNGRVYGVERVPELVAFGSTNLATYHFAQASITKAGKLLGAPEHAPFDRILVSAATNQVPTELVHQLAIGGVMVIPIGTAIVRIVKTSKAEITEDVYEGFAFVPLLTTTQ